MGDTVGGPPMLARLATETGGRLTANTNDLTLGFARAERDLGCRYTIGFYLKDQADARPRRIAVTVKRPGLRALHPEQHWLRTDADRRSGRIEAAFHAPEMFSNGFVRAIVFPLHPLTAQSWEVLIAVNFPLRFTETEPTVEYDFGGVINRQARVFHRFNRRAILRPIGEIDSGDRQFTFLEPAELKPGDYRLTIVVSDVNPAKPPSATRIDVTIPPLPKQDTVLVPPILGQPRGRNVLVRGDGPVKERASMDSELLAGRDIVASKGAFEPMLILQTDEAAQLLTRNKACLLGKGEVPDAQVERVIRQEGDPVLELVSTQLDLGLKGKVRCQNLYEVLQDNALAAGPYLFEATLSEVEDDRLEELLYFAVDEDEDE